MKKIILLFSLLYIATAHVNAQNYQFSYYTGTYTEITGGTPFLAAQYAYNDSITLPYSFTISGVTSNKLQVLSVGRITTGDYFNQSSPWFWAFEDAEINNGKYQYTTTGTTPNRITKLQFKDNQFSHEWGNGYQSRCNFQIWLYEKDYTIEVHYGPSNIVDIADCYQGAPGPAVGIPGLYANGNANAPTGSSTANYLSGTPVNGGIYRFGTPPAAVTTIAGSGNGLSIYPVPANNLLHIRSGSTGTTDLTIYDIQGKKIGSYTARPVNTSIDISSLQSGIYFLRTTDGGTARFIKN